MPFYFKKYFLSERTSASPHMGGLYMQSIVTRQGITYKIYNAQTFIMLSHGNGMHMEKRECPGKETVNFTPIVHQCMCVFVKFCSRWYCHVHNLSLH